MAAAIAVGTLGRFELRRQLGKGAQATVWLAFDPRLEREVAVKLMHPGANTLSVDQWLQEARHVSRLNHPHIVPVFEADIHNGQPYLVFEYVPGRTLSAPPARARRAAGARGGGDDGRRARRLAGGALRRRGAPRPEAQQHPGRRQRPCAGDGLRHRRAHARRGEPAAGGGHAGLHVARGHPRHETLAGAWMCSPPAWCWPRC